LAIKETRGHHHTEQLVRVSLQQFQDRPDAFKHKHSFAVARAFGLDHIPNVREMVARDPAG
jgi:hypothetical protein